MGLGPACLALALGGGPAGAVAVLPEMDPAAGEAVPDADSRLAPRIRATPLATPTPTLPLRAVAPFLTRPQVLAAGTLEYLPYVVELAEEHVLGGPGDRLYARGIDAPSPREYLVLRPGRQYVDPDTRQVLGHEAVHVGEAELETPGDPATLRLLRAEREVRPGDRLVPDRRGDRGADFKPRPGRPGLSGHILSVLEGVTQIGQFSVVALNRGRADGVEVGQVFDIWQRGQDIRDTVVARGGDALTGPEQRAGQLLTFLVEERVSFALVLRAERFIHIRDLIRSP